MTHPSFMTHLPPDLAPRVLRHCVTLFVTQIYTQLTSVMSKVFFPPGNPAVQALSIWGIFAGEGDTPSFLKVGRGWCIRFKDLEGSK